MNLYIQTTLFYLIALICPLVQGCDSSISSSIDTQASTPTPSSDLDQTLSTEDQSIASDLSLPDLALWMSEDMSPPLDLTMESQEQRDATLPSATVDLSFISPQDGMEYQAEDLIEIRAQITVEGTSLEFVALDLKLDEMTSIPFTLDQNTHLLTAQFTAPSRPGEHTLSLKASLFPDYQVQSVQTFTVACELTNPFNDPLSDQQWLSFAPAIHDARGWLELTQNQLNTKGGIFWTGETLQAGFLDVEFDFSTSKCMEPGPCSLDRINAGGGFAVNFWNLPLNQLEPYWSITRGLGHTLSHSDLQEAMLTRPESFHVVFDTYSNNCMRCGMQGEYNGCGNQHYEPTHVNHVAILNNGHKAIHGLPDESGSYCHLGIPDESWQPYWAPFPEMDDGEWHHVHLTIQGTQVELTIDEQALMTSQFPNFGFKGGILSFSAGSGVNGNFHRIDNLRVNQFCSWQKNK